MGKKRESKHNQDDVARRVEALAMQSVLEQAPDERKWREALRELSTAAASAGGTEVATIAREVAERLSGGEVRSTIGAGILQLEKAVECWKTGGATWEIAPAN